MGSNSGALVFIKPAAAPTVVGADNGLRIQGTDVYLGGTLLEDTTIDQDAFELEITDGFDRFALGNGVFRVDRVAAPNSTQILQDDSSMFLSTTGADGNNGFAMESLAGVEQLALSMTYSDFEYLLSVNDTELEEYYFDPVGGGFSQRNMDPNLYLLTVDDGVNSSILRMQNGAAEIVITVGGSTGTHSWTDLDYRTPTLGLRELAADPINIGNLGLLYAKTDNNLYFQDDTGAITNLLSGGTPGGLSGDIQYNNAGSFGGFGDWDGTTLTLGGILDMESNEIQFGATNRGLRYKQSISPRGFIMEIEGVTGFSFLSDAAVGSGFNQAIIGGLNTASGGDNILILNNGTMGAALANAIQLGSQDLSAGNTMLAIQTEGTPVGTGTPAADRTVAIEVNGTTLYFLASTTAV